MPLELAYCSLGSHEVPLIQMRKSPPSASARRQCNQCAQERARQSYVPKPKWDWADRFLERVDVVGECWEWAGALANGYGVTTVEGVSMGTHRVSYFLHNGDLPAGAFICHTCDNPACCNPAHLYAGDVQSNSDDAVARGRLNPPRGERNGHAVLTAALVLDMRLKRTAGGWTHRALAAHFGVCEANVEKVVNYKSWRHVA